jgi:hypothetical protein
VKRHLEATSDGSPATWQGKEGERESRAGASLRGERKNKKNQRWAFAAEEGRRG